MSFTISVTSEVVSEIADRVGRIQNDFVGVDVVSAHVFEGSEGLTDLFRGLVDDIADQRRELVFELAALEHAVDLIRDVFDEVDRRVASRFDGGSLLAVSMGDG